MAPRPCRGAYLYGDSMLVGTQPCAASTGITSWGAAQGGAISWETPGAAASAPPPAAPAALAGAFPAHDAPASCLALHPCLPMVATGGLPSSAREAASLAHPARLDA